MPPGVRASVLGSTGLSGCPRTAGDVPTDVRALVVGLSASQGLHARAAAAARRQSPGRRRTKIRGEGDEERQDEKEEHDLDGGVCSAEVAPVGSPAGRGEQFNDPSAIHRSCGVDACERAVGPEGSPPPDAPAAGPVNFRPCQATAPERAKGHAVDGREHTVARSRERGRDGRARRGLGDVDGVGEVRHGNDGELRVES